MADSSTRTRYMPIRKNRSTILLWQQCTSQTLSFHLTPSRAFCFEPSLSHSLDGRRTSDVMRKTKKWEHFAFSADPCVTPVIEIKIIQLERFDLKLHFCVFKWIFVFYLLSLVLFRNFHSKHFHEPRWDKLKTLWRVSGDLSQICNRKYRTGNICSGNKFHVRLDLSFFHTNLLLNCELLWGFKLPSKRLLWRREK